MQTLTVLIVEDEANLRAALAALVSREGAQSLEAANLEEARKCLLERSVDAVLIDVTLPDGSGLDLLETREAAGSPDYIVVTGDASAETAVQALKAGALDYLTKPVDRARLRSVLENLKRTRSLRTLAGSGARVLDALPAEAAAPMLAAWLDERRAS